MELELFLVPVRPYEVITGNQVIKKNYLEKWFNLDEVEPVTAVTSRPGFVTAKCRVEWDSTPRMAIVESFVLSVLGREVEVYNLPLS
jgi:hypothetical protein